MNRTKKLIRNIIIIAVLLIVFISVSGLSLDPIKAHQRSERSIHYGPSQIIKVVDLKDKELILCKYDKWISCNTVNRTLGIFWRFGSQVTGIENDTTKPISYTWSYSDYLTKIYGIINDKDIVKVVVEMETDSGDIITKEETNFSDGMFLFVIDDKDNSMKDQMNHLKSIRGYNEAGDEIFVDDKL